MRQLAHFAVTVALVMLPTLARADVPPRDACREAGAVCTNGGEHRDQKGVCTKAECKRYDRAAKTSIPYDCLRCVAEGESARGAAPAAPSSSAPSAADAPPAPSAATPEPTPPAPPVASTEKPAPAAPVAPSSAPARQEKGDCSVAAGTTQRPMSPGALVAFALAGVALTRRARRRASTAGA